MKFSLIYEAQTVDASRAGDFKVYQDTVEQCLPGVYLYLGSAFGSGGLRARLARHAARRKAERWHIDYARSHMSLAGAWFSTSPVRLEHEWATRTLVLPTATIPLARFGASDCRCPSHLFHLPDSASSCRSIEDALAVSSAGLLGRLDAAQLRGLARGTARS